MNAIQCQQISQSYGETPVLNRVDLGVREGEFFGLVGMNGSGKTTMIKAILDLVAIDSGNITLFGTPHRQVLARARVAYLPDRFSPPSHLRCNDFLHTMLALHGSKPDVRKIQSVLRGLDLADDVLTRPIGKLSKGMAQKLGLASCLLSGKSLLILDEPMSGLDPKARYLFKEQLQAMRNNGLTVFFSSHVLADVEELSDTMAVLHQSRMLYSGTAQDFMQRYRSDNLEQAYMRSIAAEETAVDPG